MSRQAGTLSFSAVWRKRCIARSKILWWDSFIPQLFLQKMQEELLKRVGVQSRRIISGVLLDGVVVDKIVGDLRKGGGLEGIGSVGSDPGE